MAYPHWILCLLWLKNLAGPTTRGRRPPTLLARKLAVRARPTVVYRSRRSHRDIRHSSGVAASASWMKLAVDLRDCRLIDMRVDLRC